MNPEQIYMVMRAFDIAKAEQAPGHRETTRNGAAAEESIKLYCPTVEKQPGRFVLDVGSGDAFLRPIFQARGWIYEGIDLYGTNGVIKGDIHFDPLPVRYDLVWSSHVLEHSPFPMLMILRMYEATRPGGYGIFVVPRLPQAVTEMGHWITMDERGWDKHFKAVGYKVERMEPGLYGGDWNEWRFLVRRP